MILLLSLLFINELLHPIIAAQILNLLRTHFFLLPSKGGEQAQQMFSAFDLIVFIEFGLVELVVDGEGLYVITFSVVMHNFFYLLQKIQQSIISTLNLILIAQLITCHSYNFTPLYFDLYNRLQFIHLNMFYIIVAVQIILALLYVAYLIYQYSMPQVSPAVKILVYLTWLLSFIIVVLLPYDIYHSMQSDYTLSTVWKVIYYLISILTWVLLPIAQEYQTAGQFTTKDKMKTAVINNLIIYGIFVVLGIAFFVYLYWKDQLNMKELLPLLMAASNAFGMFLVVIFLSHGLVAIPRQLWRQKKYQIKLKQKQFGAVGLANKKQTIIQQLQLKVKQLYWYIKKNGQSPESTYISNLIPQRYRDKWRKNVPDLGEINLVKLHRSIKEQLLELARLERRWEELVEQTFLIEDIIVNINNPTQRIQSTLFTSSKYDFINYIKWLWYCRIKSYLNPVIAIFFCLFAAAVIVAELAVFIPALSSMNLFSKLLLMETFIGLDCSMMIVMSYIVFCVYYALFKLKFASYYGLYWNRQTDASSLMFFAVNCSRISTPLCYNFLQIINHSKTAFSRVMGQANIVPVFGQTFYIIFPILLLILIVANIFDVYTMIAKMFGLQKFQFESRFQHENIEEGKRLLQKARIEIENKILNSNNKDLREYRSYKWEYLDWSRQLITDEQREFFI